MSYFVPPNMQQSQQAANVSQLYYPKQNIAPQGLYTPLPNAPGTYEPDADLLKAVASWRPADSFTSGKYKGQLFSTILSCDRSYIMYMVESATKPTQQKDRKALCEWLKANVFTDQKH